MADPMCGPSNPLQAFQKHSTVDRTLQQDRLVNRQSPSPGFRSSPGPNAVLADHEFEAFQAGQPLLENGFQRQQLPLPHSGFQQQQQTGPSGWATDFQRLNISNGYQAQQQQLYGQQAQQRHDIAGWHQDFAGQQGGMAEQRMEQMSGQTNSQYSHTTSPYGYYPMSGMAVSPGYSTGFAGQQAEMPIALQKQPVETFDEEAFARAFEAAAQSEMAANAEREQEETLQQDTEREEVMLNESAERLLASEEGLLSQERIGADTIEDPYTQDPQTAQEQNNPDALARTAGELLNSVKHDQSSKFANSQFLELMRQFRDKEATVQGDRIVGGGSEGVPAVEGVVPGGSGDEGIKVVS